MPKFVTNQIPANFTQGMSTTNMTDVFAGDWTQLLIGQRLDLSVQTLVERYAELGRLGSSRIGVVMWPRPGRGRSPCTAT